MDFGKVNVAEIHIIFITQNETSCNGSTIKDINVHRWPGENFFLALSKMLR